MYSLEISKYILRNTDGLARKITFLEETGVGGNE